MDYYFEHYCPHLIVLPFVNVTLYDLIFTVIVQGKSLRDINCKQVGSLLIHVMLPFTEINIESYKQCRNRNNVTFVVPT